MRIISGSARGRKLEVPKAGTRPTSDRLKEAMFSTIDSHLAQRQAEWGHINFVDLFAGTGAIGLEAKSRGAHQVVLVENDPKARKIIENNSSRSGLAVHVANADAYLWVPTFKVNILFLDPPYDHPDAQVQQYFARICDNSELAGALLICERGSRSVSPFDLVSPEVMPLAWERIYGDSKLWYGQVDSDPNR
jgi:16S rRNA (guanine966-N2)-methyltransferase